MICPIQRLNRENLRNRTHVSDKESENFIVIVSLIIVNIFLRLGDIPSYNKIQIIVRK